MNWIVSIAWACVSMTILFDFHQGLLRHVSIPGIVHIVKSVFFVIHGFLAMELEIDAVKYTRGMTSSALCVLSIYTLNINDLRASRHDSFSSCVDRFAVVDQYVSAVYVAIALIMLDGRHRSSQAPSVQVADLAARRQICGSWQRCRAWGVWWWFQEQHVW